MRAFHYEALAADGRRRAGVGYALTATGLRDQLVEAQLHPIRIRPALLQGQGALRLTPAEAARFARDLAQLMRSGMAVAQALALLESRETPKLAAIARAVRQRLIAGEPLSQALEAASGPAARLLQSLARGGEASGRQVEVLASGAATLKAMDDLQRRLVTLSVYPVLVILVALGAVGVYAWAVLPALEPAFAGLGQDIPAQTRAVLTFGAVVRAAAPPAAILIALVAAALVLSAPLRRFAVDGLARLAMQGRTPPLRDFVFANLASRLSVMIRAGVPLAPAWRLAREPISITWLARALADRDDRLMEGGRLSDILRATPRTPPDLLHYVAMGEQSAQVADALHEASVVLSVRAQETIERLLSAVTPVVILVVGALVGLITLMIFQGLLAIGDAVAV